ncbi:MAG: DUF937 domain-containing protein [Rhizobiales bacterium]|nr:DUF937 domain-containing protein [Hyphomicrobiales bacterium]
MNNIPGGLLGEILKGALGGNTQPQPQQLPDIFGEVLKNTDLGSIGGLLKQLHEGGLERQIGSWLGNGQNLPVTPTQIRDALGNEQVRQIAQQMGIPVDDVLKLLTQFFPEAVNQANPDGKLAGPHAG